LLADYTGTSSFVLLLANARCLNREDAGRMISIQLEPTKKTKAALKRLIGKQISVTGKIYSTSSGDVTVVALREVKIINAADGK